MEGLRLKKSLIGKEDIFFGRRTQTQERNKQLIDIAGVNVIYPVESLDELKNINPNEFTTAFIVKDSMYQATPDGEMTIIDGSNEFYYFDFTSEEDENLPDIVESSFQKFGRWKISNVGESRMIRVVKVQLEKQIPALVSAVVDNVKQELSDIVKQVTDELKKQGLIYDKDLTYYKNQLTTSLVKTNKGIEARKYLALENGITEAPVKGDLYSSASGITIYKDNQNLKESSKYTRIVSSQKDTKSFEIPDVGTYYLFNVNPTGKVRFTTKQQGQATATFDVTFSGLGLKEFSIDSAHYSYLIKGKIVTDAYGYIFYPGFAIFSDGNYFGISVADTKFIDEILIDFTDLDVVPYIAKNNLIHTNCYAIRPNGGTYIQGLGSLYPDYMEDKIGLDGICYEFSVFMTGRIPYSAGMTLDKRLYHQYASSSCVAPTADISGRVIRNIGGNAVGIGETQEDAVRDWGYTKNFGNFYNNYSDERDWSAVGSYDVKKDRYIQPYGANITVQFKVSDYVQVAVENRMVAVTGVMRLQVF